MYQKKDDACYASEIAGFLQKDLIGENHVIYQPCSLENLKENSVLFLSKRACEDGFDLSRLNGFSQLFVILYDGFSQKPSCTYIISSQPRLDFVKVLYRFFVKELVPGIHSSAIIEKGAKLGKGIYVGAHSYIGEDVSIDDNTRIGNSVVISGKVNVGSNCVIKSNSTIGSEGFSFVTESKNLEHFPQIGKIIIGDNVWIGANATIERAALEETVISDDVKIDDLVQIGHNCFIGKASQITAGTIVCGRAKIGDRVWVAPNVCIDSGVVVGDDAWLGIGSVVLRDVEVGAVVVGNPARFLKQRKDLKAMQ